MRWLLTATVVLTMGAAVSTASAAGLPDPCALITPADASLVFGSTPPKAKTATVGTTRSCRYVMKKRSVTIATSRVASQAAFDKAAKTGHGLAFPIQGIGSVHAWSTGQGKLLLTWLNGVQVSFTFAGVSPFVATQQSLVKTATGRL